MKYPKPGKSARHHGLWWLAYHYSESAKELDTTADAIEDPIVRRATKALAGMRMVMAYALMAAADDHDPEPVESLRDLVDDWAAEQPFGASGLTIGKLPADPEVN